MSTVDELMYVEQDDFETEEPKVKKNNKVDKVEKPDHLDTILDEETKRDIANISLQREHLLDQINSMMLAFPEELAKYKKYNFQILNEETLDKLIKTMDHRVSFQQNLDLGVRWSIMGSEMVEYVATEFTPLDIQGFSSVIKNDTLLHKNVKLMMIRNQRLRESTPEQRIGLSVLSTMLMLHTGNTHRKEMEKAKNEPSLEENVESETISKQKEADLEKLANKYAEI